MREIADRAGAVLMVDMAHFAGLVAGKAFEGEHNPIPYAHVATTTTHKTLRGPRGGLVLCTSEFAEQVDKGCPLVLGGPLPHVMAAKAVCFTEALRPEFEAYARQVIENARALSDAFIAAGLKVITGGTDNHLILLDVTPFGLSGRQAESAVRECGITLNRNTIPYDPNGPWYTSGLRLGTPAVTTLGMGTAEMDQIASIMTLILSNTVAVTTKTGNTKVKYQLDEAAKQESLARVKEMLDKYPVYPEIDLEFLQKHISPDNKTAADE
jgi:glycine hydroxymethyltransferase